MATNERPARPHRRLPVERNSQRWGVAARRIAALGLALTFLGLAGCSGNDNAGPAVASIDSILAGDIKVVSDPSGTSATLSVKTSIPVACAVVFGTDRSYGSIAVDNDMQGGAHESHSPQLTGLTPDTEYQYILQGSDAAGKLYRSDPMTFRTPATATTGLGTNVAPTGTVTAASSSFSDQFAARLAIDGDLATEWSTAGDGDKAWIEIDLGEPTKIDGVAFRTRQMTDGSAITETFTVTIDGTELGPFPAGSKPVALDQAVTGQKLRFDADRTTGGNTGATEIEIYRSE